MGMKEKTFLFEIYTYLIFSCDNVQLRSYTQLGFKKNRVIWWSWSVASPVQFRNSHCKCKAILWRLKCLLLLKYSIGNFDMIDFHKTDK